MVLSKTPKKGPEKLPNISKAVKTKHHVLAILGAKHEAESVPIPGAIGYSPILAPDYCKYRNNIKSREAVAPHLLHPIAVPQTSYLTLVLRGCSFITTFIFAVD